MLSIDNSVELMAKTFLGLPRRADGPGVPKRKLEDAQNSFPKLLDVMEEYGAARLEGVDLAHIEHFHRLRNALYHEGNGITVEREKVETYAAMAKQLFLNLFGYEIDVSDVGPRMAAVGSFLRPYALVEQRLAVLTAVRHHRMKGQELGLRESLEPLVADGTLSESVAARVLDLRDVRNAVVHGVATPSVLDAAQAEVGEVLLILDETIRDHVPNYAPD